MKGIYLLLGSNDPDKLKALQTATDLLKKEKLSVICNSGIYESEPWGIKEQDWFLNIVLEITTDQPPEALMDACLKVEKKMGRVRSVKWGPRLIDIDILYYGMKQLVSEHLTLPHPEIQNRRFTLLPLIELAEHEVHPVLNISHKEMLQRCEDKGKCRRTNLEIKL